MPATNALQRLDRPAPVNPANMFIQIRHFSDKRKLVFNLKLSQIETSIDSKLRNPKNGIFDPKFAELRAVHNLVAEHEDEFHKFPTALL